MSEKKYPYIGDNGFGQIVLIYGKDSVFHISGRYQGEFNDEYNETGVKNIAREYLTNTYGKCESKEHADFICKLAENNGFNVINDYSELKGRIWFVISCYRIEFFSMPHDTKLIHLPLPPKEKGIPEVKPIYTKEMHERGEYPPIGSKVKLRVGYGVVELGVDSNGFFPVLTNGKYQLLDVGSVKPITTIEDELFDITCKFIGKEITQADLVYELLDKYSITPKGE